jgi:hypothetical protein
MPSTNIYEEIRFRAGRTTVTPAAATALEAARVHDILLLARHLHGDWGDLGERDCLQNELAVLLELRIQSRYALPSGAVIQIVTGADRSTTTILLADGG